MSIRDRMIYKGVIYLVYVYLRLRTFVVRRCHEIEGGVVIHRVYTYCRLKVVMTRRSILGPVARSWRGVHRMSLGLAVVRMRCVATRKKRC